MGYCWLGHPTPFAGTVMTDIKLDHRTHVKPALQSLHWLPVKARIEFKIAIMIHAIFRQRDPAYLSNIVKFIEI